MPKTHRPLTVAALLLSAFMGAMEMTVVSTAMPTVITELGGISVYAWVFTAYILATTITVPLYGKIADLIGRKPVMLFGIAVFLLGSMGSGLAQSMPQLIALRALQGIGSGAIQPISLTIVGDIFTVRERAKMQGLFGAVWGVAGLIGPMLGGLIVKLLSWRWVFFINVPFGIASALILLFALHEGVEKKRHKLDWLGALLLALGIVALLAAGHGSTWIYALPTAALLLIAFLMVEKHSPEPVLPLELFRQRAISVSSLAGALIGGAMISTTTFVPLFVQGVDGGTPTQAGLAITPMAIGWPIASTVAGRLLPKLGYRPLVRIGFGLTLASSLVLALLLRPGAGLLIPQLTTAMLGLGLGFANTTLLLAVQTSVGWEQRGVVTASTMMFRTIGGALAVGAMGSVLAAALSRDPAASADAANELLGPTHGRGLAPEVLRSLSGSLQSALGMIFWMIVGLAACALLASLAFPKMSTKATESSPGH